MKKRLETTALNYKMLVESNTKPSQTANLEQSTSHQNPLSCTGSAQSRQAGTHIQYANSDASPSRTKIAYQNDAILHGTVMKCFLRARRIVALQDFRDPESLLHLLLQK